MSNPIGINMFTSVDNVFSLHKMDSDLSYRYGYYDEYFDYTVDTNRYSDFYFFYDGYNGLDYEDFELTVTDENGNVINFAESGSLYKLESLKDYKMYGYDLPEEGTMMTVGVSYEVFDVHGDPTGEIVTVVDYVPWFDPTQIYKTFYTEPMHYTHYQLRAPVDFDSTKFVHSITEPTIETRIVPLDPQDYYDKEQVDQRIEDIIVELEPVQGTTFTPAVTSVTGGYELSWTNDGGKTNPETVTIHNGATGATGATGAKGTTFTPTITPRTRDNIVYEYVLSWSNDGGLPNPYTAYLPVGTDGTTFTPSVTTIAGGHQLSWSNDGGKTNPSTVTILDGVNGQDGADGQDGYTPVRGTDYWTAADIATIQNYIDTELGVISNGSY